MLMKKLAVIIVSVIFMTFILSCAAWGGEIATPELTMQQAVDQAIASSKSLRTIKLDTERTYLERQHANDQVPYVPQTVGPLNPLVEGAFTAFLSKDLIWQMTEKSYEMAKDSVEYQTRLAYNDLIKAINNLSCKEWELKLAEQKKATKQAQERVGLASKVDLISADTDLSSAKAAYETAKKQVDDAYVNFNQLVGLNPEDRPVLTEIPEIKPLEVANIDVKIRQTIDASPTVYNAEKKELMYDIKKDFYDNMTEQRTGKIEYEQSQIGVYMTKDALSKGLYNTYNAIRQLEEGYLAQQDALKLAEEGVRVTQVRYDIGMATKQDLLEAQVTVVKLKQSMLESACTHMKLKDIFQKPWAAA